MTAPEAAEETPAANKRFSSRVLDANAVKKDDGSRKALMKKFRRAKGIPAAEEVVVGKAKLMNNEIVEEPEAKVEKLNIPVEDKGTEVKETVTEVPAADINSSDKLNIVIDNAPASVSSPAPVPAAANDNIPLENSAAQ